VAATLLAQNCKNYTKDEQNIILKSSSSYKISQSAEHNSLFCFHTTTKRKTERASGVGKKKQKPLNPKKNFLPWAYAYLLHIPQVGALFLSNNSKNVTLNTTPS
jgi:hypothetical protein